MSNMDIYLASQFICTIVISAVIAICASAILDELRKK